MATKNISIKPSDGWVEAVPAGTTFVRFNQYPNTQPFYLNTAPTGDTPDPDSRGFRVDCDNFYCDVVSDEAYFIRVENTTPDRDLRIDILYFTEPAPGP